MMVPRNPAAGDDLVPGLQVVQHLLPLLLAALLRHDQEKVEDGKDEDQRGKPQPARPIRMVCSANKYEMLMQRPETIPPQ